MLYRLFESLYKLYKIDLAPFWSSTQKHLHLSFGFTNAGYSNLETCFSCHAWDLTIHDLFLLKTGTRSGWRRLAIHLILVFHLLCTALGFPISIYISCFTVYLPFPIIFFVFFFTPETAPLYSIHMGYSLRSHHSVDNHLIITNVEADNHISNRWDCKLVHSIRILA